MNATGYETLADVLMRAFAQAASGKGAERHGCNLPFDRQPMQQIVDMFGFGFPLGQAAKKMQEAQRLPPDRAVAELLGAINYIAGAVISLERSTPVSAPAQGAGDDNGWIAWGGGNRYGPDEARGKEVFVRIRSGFEPSKPDSPERLRWTHTGDASDVIAYRVVTPAAAHDIRCSHYVADHD